MADAGDKTSTSCEVIPPAMYRRDFRACYKIIVAAVAIIGLFAICVPGRAAGEGNGQPSWSLANVGGRWSSGDCRIKYYDFSISGNEAYFRDQSGAVDVERITEVRNDGFSAVTVSASSSSSIGTRWSYTFNGDRVRIEELNTHRQFAQTRCGSTGQQVAAPTTQTSGSGNADWRWTKGYGQGTSEAIIHANNGWSLNIYCAEGGDGKAGVILGALGVNLNGEHVLQVVVDGRNTAIDLHDGSLEGGWRNGDNAIYMLVDSLLKAKSRSFKAELPDLNLSVEFSMLNARDALAFRNPMTRVQQTIVEPCMK